MPAIAAPSAPARLTAAKIRELCRAEIADSDFAISDEEIARVADKVKADLDVQVSIGDEQLTAIAEHVAANLPLVKTVTVEILRNAIPVATIAGAHAALAEVLELASERIPILLVGPAGCGKTHLADQVAAALGLSFAHISCSAGMSEGQLLGRLVPTGKGGAFEYLRSEFVRCYEEGGVFLFDEIDAADANTLLILNSALANGKLAVPNRPDKPEAIRHPDFVCIAAANTYGTGADRLYVGRNQLDESTLDRFRVGQIELDYDPAVEAAVCPDATLRNRLQGYRAKTRDAKVRRVVSMRFAKDASRMLARGWSLERIDQALFSGWGADEIAKVRGR